MTDGVFAIVMTLLVLDLHVPDVSDAQLAHALQALAPHLAIYAVSFLVLGVLWFGHRTQFEFIHRADHTLIWGNLCFLAAVAIIPFSAALLGEHIHDRLAVVIYGVNLTSAAALHAAMWTYATRRPLIHPDHSHPNFIRVSRRLSLLPCTGYAAGTVLAALSPTAAIALYLLTPIPYVTGIFYRLMSRATAQTDPADGRPRPRRTH